MALDENISALIGRIYESADDDGRWVKLLHDIRELMGARCLLQSVSDLRHKDMQRSLVIGDPSRDQGVDEYREHAYALDPSFRWATKHPQARFCDTQEILPRDGYLENEGVKWNRDEWIGSTHWIVGYTAPDDELTFGLSVHPWAHDGPLPAEKKALFRMLFEHMERAIRLAARPPIFARPDHALILVDRGGHVREASPAAQELLAADDGLTVVQGQLQAMDPLATQQLDAAILSALRAREEGGFGGAVSVPRPSGLRDYLITVTPLISPPTPFEAFRPAGLIRIVDPDQAPADEAVQIWWQLFGLTPAELRFARLLMCEQQDIHSASSALGIAYATARVHLRSLLEKTQTHSQRQLTILLSRLS